MGGWFSDVRGGQQAVGGGAQRRRQGEMNDVGQNVRNDAVDFFYTSHGQQALFTPMELSLSASKLRDRDIISKMLKLNDQEFLGEASCVLSEIVTKQSRSLTLNLQSKNGHRGLKNLGTLTVHAQETVASRKAVEMTFRCSHLENKDVFTKSDPFLRISRIVERGGSVPICKTEVVNNNLNPTWKPICLTMQQFGSKVLKGQLFVDQYCEKDVHSFIDYISSGFELNFMVAVDFTASNGNPRNLDSLHYIDPSGRLNAYQQAIMEVGEVIQFYDSDRRFPAWGFGGKTYNGAVSHCFNLNGSASGFEHGVYSHAILQMLCFTFNGFLWLVVNFMNFAYNRLIYEYFDLFLSDSHVPCG
ncbi:hypothetical protein L1049_020171 [Liquidambar formosana]|uniref:C2 domain-containing protein n=1 Tax=Liquidambar formosana TaxID=63359 RepID=A0AAP0X3F6_LIQFO